MASRNSSLIFHQIFDSVMHPQAKQLRWSYAKVQETIAELGKVREDQMTRPSRRIKLDFSK